MSGAIALVVLVALLGMPIFAVLALVSLVTYHAEGISFSSVAVEMYRLAEAPLLIAIPMFTFVGYLLAESGAPRRLVRLSQALLGWMPGGLALVTLVACALFNAFTGASGVTIIALGGPLLPALLAQRYPEKFVDGLLTTSGSLGLLFPPSLPIILYGFVAGTSVDKLFAAGILPGVLLIVLLSVYAARVSIRHNVPRQPFEWRALREALRDAAWEVPLPFLVVGGIYSGKVTLNEAASLTAMYALVVEVAIYRNVPIRRLPRILTESMVLVGALVVIMGAAFAMTNYFVTAEIPNRLFDWSRNYIDARWEFLILLNLFLILVGCLMHIYEAILVVVPLIVPVAAQYGVDPVHLGIIFLTNLEIGYSFPPVGLNLFYASLRFEKPVMSLARSALPFLGLYFIALAIITYWPALSLWLVGLMGAE
jgi:tripartite ATP-independent transporter DctM subunit